MVDKGTAKNPEGGAGSWMRDGQQYVTEVQTELRKVTWPGQKEYVGGTIGVVVVVGVVTLVLGVADALLSRAVQWMLP